MAATAMTGRLSEERRSEEMSVATRASFAVAENESFPIHAVQVLLKSWIPGKVKLEVRRKAPAKRAVVRGVVRCCSGSRRERARRGMRYGRWADRLNPEVMLEASAIDPRIARAPARFCCVFPTLGGAVVWSTVEDCCPISVASALTLL